MNGEKIKSHQKSYYFSHCRRRQRQYLLLHDHQPNLYKWFVCYYYKPTTCYYIKALLSIDGKFLEKTAFFHTISRFPCDHFFLLTSKQPLLRNMYSFSLFDYVLVLANYLPRKYHTDLCFNTQELALGTMLLLEKRLR